MREDRRRGTREKLHVKENKRDFKNREKRGER